jgi:hypothetical protein
VVPNKRASSVLREHHVLVMRRGYSAKVAKVLSLFSSLWDLFSEFNFGRLSNEVLSLTGMFVLYQ